MAIAADPQATAYRWATRRQEQHPDAPKVNTAQASGRVYDVLRDLADRYSHIVIDSGGHASDAMKSAMLGAQTVYAPLRPSQADLETVGELVGIIRDVKALNPDLTARALLSMVPTNPSITEAHDAREALQDIPEMTLSRCVIRDRKVYRDALLEGVGVVEMTASKAVAEIQLLAQEVFTDA